MQYLKRAFTAFTVFATILWSLGLPTFNIGLPPQNAQAAIADSSIVLSDPDTTGNALDGRDFQVAWTVTGDAPAGYTATEVFIVPASIVGSLNASNVKVNGCTGPAACQSRGFFPNYFQNMHRLPDFETKDSQGTAFSASTAYRACIFTDATSDALNCSTVNFSPTSETGLTDAQPPFVDHMSVFNLTTGVNAVFNAIIRDDITTATEFASTTTAAELKLFYGTGLTASVSGVQASGSLFSFTVPSGSVPAAGQQLQYYIRAKDKAGQTEFFCQNFNATSAIDCQPISATAIAAGSRSISGTIKQSGTDTPIASAKVFVGGYASAAATTNGSGVYTISGLPDNSSFDVIAYKDGFCDNRIMKIIGTENLSGVNFNLNLGDCTFTAPSGGGGGPSSGGKPHVMFSGPPDFGNFVPLTEKIRVGFDQALNAATVTTTNVYLTPDNGTNKITGSVTYCASKSADLNNTCSNLFTGDQNVILFIPSSNLTANTFYTLVVTDAVTSSSGQSVEGNREGGGHNVRFNTGGDTTTTYSTSNITTNYGTNAQYMPPYVQSVMPGPGASAPLNAKVLVTFNEAMKGDTITSTNIKLQKIGGSAQTVTVSLDNNTKKVVTVTPAVNLTAGDYEVQVLGAAANANGITMRPPAEGTQVAFRANFSVSSTASADTTPPTIFPMIATASTGVAVNQIFEFGFNEPADASTLTTSTITMARGSTASAVEIQYDPGKNSVFVIPTAVLAQNTGYTVTFGTGVKDLQGVALATAQSFTYTTGSSDTTAPKLKGVRCDDGNCTAEFTEPMNHDTRVDSNFASSLLNSANLTLTQGAGDIINASSTATISYNPVQFSVSVKGVALTRGQSFVFTIVSAAKDMSGNGIVTDGSANVFNGMVEDSRETYGSFDNMGMYGPPMGGGTNGVGDEFKSQGFGSFTAEQFASGDAVEARPFNMIAGQDVNVMHIGFKPGIVLQNDDQIVLTFPSGMGVANAIPDTFSPFFKDMNEAYGAGTVAFDTALDTDGVSVDSTAFTVTAQLAISGGTPGASDRYVIDLRSLTNPLIPKDPMSGGYSVTIQIKRAGAVQKTLISMPFFIGQAGSRSITVNLKAGNAATPDNVAGNVFLHGGGPSGPLDQQIAIVAGSGSVTKSGLTDGCYFFGTDPFVTLGSNDYFGQMSPEPICVNASNSAPTKTIVLSSASASAGTSLEVTIKITGAASFNGNDIDIFAGGPGRFVVKTLSSLNAPLANGYTLQLPSTGSWFIGMGPGMAKGKSMSIPKALPCTPPSPVDIKVVSLGAAGTMATGFQTPRGVTVDTATKTITFACTTADKTISGTVNDGTTGIANVNVDMHSQGFGVPMFAQTNSAGAFSLSVSDYGTYELCAFKDGLPPNCNHIDVAPDGSDAGTDIDIKYKGKQITGSNPLVIRLKKGTYTISGKILDANSNPISYAPVFAEDANKNFVPGGSSEDGSYNLFVDAGTWTVRSMLPPDKTDSCGTFSKTVTITTESKSSQNISPSTGTCYTLSGTVTVGGNLLANVPIFIAEWDSDNNRPSAAGIFRPTSTNSSGAFSAQVAGSKTYRVGMRHPDYGELFVTKAVTTSNVTDANINSGTLGTVTVAFTGGTAAMEALVELKSAADQFQRISKTQKGLSANMTFSVASGTYNYFVNVIGVGQYTGTVATGATATVDLSSSNVVTLSGNINDASGSDIKGAIVTLKGSDGTITTATADASGNYSASVKAGTYSVSASNAEYIPPQAATVTLSSSTSNYDWGGSNPDQTALSKSDQVISGTIYKSDGTTPAAEGFVQATNTTTGAVITAPIESNGTYSLPVDDGTYQIKAATSGHAKTALSTNVAVSGTTDATSKNITLTADSTKTASATTDSLAANVGGSIDDTDTTKIKLTAGAGVLTTGSSNVTVTMEQTFAAPDTTALKPLGDALFSITAKSGDTAIEETKGNVESTFDYESLLGTLPTGVSESDLKLAYISGNSYVPNEGGFTIDVTNNKITGQTDHFTDFAIVYSPVGSTPTTTTTSTGGTSGGGGGAGSTIQDLTTTKPIAKVTETPKVPTTPTTPAKSPSALQIERILSEAKVLITGSVDEVVKLVRSKRDAALEKKLSAIADKVIGKTKLTTTERTTIDVFIVYGTPETKQLGAGERAGVIGSYQAAFGTPPKTEAAWTDVLKIANGRWPGATSKTAEDRAKKAFVAIYKRDPENNPNDNAAITIMAYGLRGKRNLANEAAAIKTLEAIKGRKSSTFTSYEWDQVRAIAYSGATRKSATKTGSSTVKTASQ